MVLEIKIYIFFLFGLAGCFSEAYSQHSEPPLPVDVNFLFHYYEQDGNHAAVTGGTGTEKLFDRSGIIVVNIPLDTATQLGIRAGANHYSSASTDNIDARVSSASAADTRARLYMTFTKENVSKRQTYSLQGGGSVESDYISTSLAGTWSTTTKDQNQTLNLGIEVFFDTWVIYFPDELRGSGLDVVPTDKRRSVNLAANYSFVINKRMQANVGIEVAVQQGLLSTPFHRVYFPSLDTARVENLPTFRVKVPISASYRYFVNDFLILNMDGRLYWDTFGIFSQTVSLKSPVKLGKYVTTYPFYRFHHQRASRYFAGYKEHIYLESRYFTSDYDLSGFQTHTYGLGLYIEPLYGFGRFRYKNRYGKFKSIDTRFARYIRSDGLESWWVGMDLGFEF